MHKFSFCLVLNLQDSWRIFNYHCRTTVCNCLKTWQPCTCGSCDRNHSFSHPVTAIASIFISSELSCWWSVHSWVCDWEPSSASQVLSKAPSAVFRVVATLCAVPSVVTTLCRCRGAREPHTCHHFYCQLPPPQFWTPALIQTFWWEAKEHLWFNFHQPDLQVKYCLPTCRAACWCRLSRCWQFQGTKTSPEKHLRSTWLLNHKVWLED